MGTVASTSLVASRYCNRSIHGNRCKHLLGSIPLLRFLGAVSHPVSWEGRWSIRCCNPRCLAQGNTTRSCRRQNRLGLIPSFHIRSSILHPLCRTSSCSRICTCHFPSC